MTQWLWKFDETLFLWINGWSGSWLDYLLAWPSFLGRGYILLGLVLVVMMIWDGRNTPKRFLSLTLALASVGIAVRILKELVERPRPYPYFYEAIAQGKVMVNCIFEMGVANSFPSGHAALVFAAAAILNYFYSQKLLFLYPLAFLISFSRIYTGVHFPTDVLGGMLVGMVGGAIAIWIFKRFLRLAGTR